MKGYIKAAAILIVLGILGGLALPVTNLVVGPPTGVLAGMAGNPAVADVKTLLETKCVNCHTPQYKLPFYAQFPVAKQVIELDIRLGLDYLDMAKELAGPAPGETMLAKTQYVIEHKTMPPLRYAALHWDAFLSGGDRERLLGWIKDTRSQHYGGPEIVRPLPATIEGLDPAKVAMGDKVFHDKRLSKDNTIACASCHGLDKGGTDREKFSTGVANQVGDINAPTVFNSALQFIMFWDGRAANLEEQADGPVNNPIEMASNWPEAVAKLQQDAPFMAEFTALYPAGPSKETLIDAIATFERSLMTPNSKFDKYLAGDKQALSAEELAGYELFLDKACATCHVGTLLGGQSFEKMGRKQDYFQGKGQKRDFGRFNVTNKEEDRFRLKVPTLRNIAQTAPYFHDATAADLTTAVDVMGKYQSDVALSEAQNRQIVQFLTALTGELRGKLLP